MPTIYRIANWELSFETYETKKLAHLKWVPVPNKHDGLGFRRVAAQKNRCDLFAAWNLILQVASKGRKDVERGALIRDGQPLTPDDLAIMTGFPASIFETAFAFFSSPAMGWLVVDNQGTGEPPVKTAESRTKTAASPAEWKEGMEGNGREENGTPEAVEGSGELGLEIPQNLRTPAFLETWGRWVPFRQKMKSCKDWVSLFQGQLNWLGTFPEATAISMIEQSIRNGWQGVFEVKASTTVHRQPDRRSREFTQPPSRVKDL